MNAVVEPVAATKHFNEVDNATKRQQAIEDAIARTRQRLDTLTANAFMRADSHMDATIALAI